MDYTIIKLKQSLDGISNKKLFKKFFIRKKVYESKKILKNTILNKASYSALDIISFVNVLKMMNILGYEVLDDDLTYTYSNKNISNDIDFAILTFNTKYDDNSNIKISYKAKLENQLDRIGIIDIEFIIMSTIDNLNNQNTVDNSIRYTISTKTIDKNINNDILSISNYSYEVLYNIFLIYIEKILDEIERKYIYEH